MRQKLLLALPLLVLMVASVFAVVVSTSTKAKGGNVDYIGDLQISKISISDLSAWTSKNKNDVYQGKATFVIQGKTSDNKNFRLSLNLKLNSVLADSSEELYVDNTATGVYSVQGSLPKTIKLTSVTYDLNRLTGTVDVIGIGDVDFQVTGMNLR